VEQRFNVQRALCVIESAHAVARIPEPMSKQPMFPAYDNGAATMASFVAAGNRAGINTKLDSVLQRISGDMLAPQVELLSRDEHLNILEQRLAYWLTSENPQTNISDQGRAAREIMSTIGEPYTEVEDIVREVRKIVLEPGPIFKRNDGIDEAALCRVVSIAELVASSLSTRNRAEVARTSEQWLYDLLLKPLLLAVTIDSLRTVATRVYQSVCEALLLGQQADKVPIYLRVLHAVTDGSRDIESVVRQGTLWLLENR
jgi:hypothetical protein